MKRLEQLCHQYTNLSESDIKELQRTARYLSSTTLYQSADVFIDVYKEMSQQALVVYHKPPAKTTSLYSGDVVGMERNQLVKSTHYLLINWQKPF